MGIALLIIIINTALGIIIRKFAAYEKHDTYTGFCISIAKKLGIVINRL